MFRWRRRACAVPGRSGGWRQDDGQTAVDYIGMVVVVVAVIAAMLAAGVGKDIAETIKVAICRAMGGNCRAAGPGGGRPQTDQDFEPVLCNTENRTDTSGGKVKIAFLEFGNEYSFTEQTFADNSPEAKKRNGGKPGQRVMLTFNDSVAGDAKLSKPGVKLGKIGKGDIEVGGGIKVGAGDTWVFNSKEEADKFRDDLWQLELAKQNSMQADAGIGAAYGYADLKEKVQKKMGNNKISFGKASASVSGDLTLTGSDKKDGEEGSGGSGDAEGGLEQQLETDFGIKGKLQNEVTVANNDAADPPMIQKTYTVAGEYDGRAQVSGGPFKQGGEIGQKATGTITVSRYKDGTLARIDMTRAVETRGKGTVDGKKTKDSGEVDKNGDPKNNKGTGKVSEKGAHLETTTNSVVFPKNDKSSETLADRRTAEDWLSGGNSKYGKPWAYVFGGDQALTDDPGEGDPFGHMMFERGTSSRTTHSAQTDAQEYGFEVHMGLSLGASFGWENEKQNLSEAQFLGAPQGGKRTYKPYSYCAQ